MSCILHFGGNHLDVAALIDSVSMSPDRTWLRGQPRSSSPTNDSRHEDSGLTFLASGADFSEFNQQVVEATSFLQKNREDILRISGNTAVEYGTLDFGVSLRDVMVHSDVLTADFLQAVAGLGIEVEISHYPCEN